MGALILTIKLLFLIYHIISQYSVGIGKYKISTAHVTILDSHVLCDRRHVMCVNLTNTNVLP